MNRLTIKRCKNFMLVVLMCIDWSCFNRAAHGLVNTFHKKRKSFHPLLISLMVKKLPHSCLSVLLNLSIMAAFLEVS